MWWTDPTKNLVVLQTLAKIAYDSSGGGVWIGEGWLGRNDVSDF